MLMNRTTCTALLALAFPIFAASPALAQLIDLPTARNVDSLFGRSRPDAPQQLDLLVTSLGGYDASLGPAAPAIAGAAAQDSASFGTFAETVSYERHLQTTSFSLVQSSNVRYYGGGGETMGVQHAAGGGLQTQVGRHSFVSLSQSIAYIPFYTYSALPQLYAPDLAPMIGTGPSDLLVQQRQYFMSSTMGTFRSELGARTTFTMAGHYERTDFMHENSGSQNGGADARLSFGLTKSLSLVTGYGLYQALYRSPGEDLRTREHNIDVGLMFNRPLSLSRHTTVAFTSGTTALQSSTGSTQLYVTVDARLNHEVGRSWQATAAYHRGVQYIEGVNGPMFGDALSVSFGGSPSRRVSIAMVGGYSLNTIALSAASSGRDRMASASSRVHIALSHQAALTAEYVYYHYGDAFLIAPGLPLQVSRQGLRIGVDFFCPLLRN